MNNLYPILAVGFATATIAYRRCLPMAVEHASLKHTYAKKPSYTASLCKIVAQAALPKPQKLPVPHMQCDVMDIGVSEDRVKNYCKLLNIQPRHDAEGNLMLPPLFLQLEMFEAQLEVLSRSEFPFPVMGAVHTKNRTRMFRPVQCREPLQLTFELEGGRRTDSGHTELPARAVFMTRSAREPVFEVTAHFTILGKKKEGEKKKLQKREIQFQNDWEKREQWSLASSVSRQYAWLSGDINPIHLWPFVAKVFGFRSNVLHAMFNCARAVETVGVDYSDAARFPLESEFEFVRPLLLPATVECVVQKRSVGATAATSAAASSGSQSQAVGTEGSLQSMDVTLRPVENRTKPFILGSVSYRP